jgi:hypothetical protein
MVSIGMRCALNRRQAHPQEADQVQSRERGIAGGSGQCDRRRPFRQQDLPSTSPTS